MKTINEAPNHNTNLLPFVPYPKSYREGCDCNALILITIIIGSDRRCDCKVETAG